MNSVAVEGNRRVERGWMMTNRLGMLPQNDDNRYRLIANNGNRGGSWLMNDIK